MIDYPLVVIPHCGLLLPNAIAEENWPHKYSPSLYADWLYDLSELIPAVSVIKFPYSSSVVDVEKERENQSPEGMLLYDWFYRQIMDVECTYVLIGKTSAACSVDGKGNLFSASVVVLDEEKSGEGYLPTAPAEQTAIFVASLRESMPAWRVENNTTYRDECSSLRHHFKAAGISVLTVVMDESLYASGGKVDVLALNRVRRVIAKAFLSILT